MSGCLVILMAGLAVSGAAGADEPASAVLLDGESFAARIERIEADWTIRFQSATGTRSVAARDLFRWGRWTDSFRLMQIILADDSLLVAQIAGLVDERLVVDGEVCGRLELPLAALRGVLVDPPPAAEERDRLVAQIAAAQGADDRLILRDGDVLRGVLKTVRPRQATNDARSLVAVFGVDGRDVEIPEQRIRAMIFNPALIHPATKPAFYAVAGFRDGSLLNVVGVAHAPSDSTVRLTLVGGVSIDVEPPVLTDELRLLQPIGQRIAYASDLPPLGYKHIPYLTAVWPLGRDRSVTGQRLRCAGETFPKGLGMHSASRVAYRLDGHWRRFEAALALDETAGRGGSVIFRVFLGDGSDQWQRAYESPVVRGGEPPVPLTVDVTDARAIALIVDFADEADVLDRAVWIDARFTK